MEKARRTCLFAFFFHPLLAAAVIHASAEEVLQSGAVTTFSADGLAEEALEVLDVFDGVGYRGQPVMVVRVRLLLHPLAVLGRANSLLQLAKVLGSAVDGAGAVVVVVEDDLVQDSAAAGEEGVGAENGPVILVIIAAVVAGGAAMVVVVAALAAAAAAVQVQAEAQRADPDGDGEGAGRVVGVVALAGVELRLVGGDEEGSGVLLAVHDVVCIERRL